MANAGTYNHTKQHFAEGSAAATPDAGEVVVYAKTDGKLYLKDDAGTETDLTSGGSGDVSTDAIFDAKGDLVVGTGANTASRLAVGTNDYVLTADSAEATGLKWAAAAGGSTFVGASVYKSADQDNLSSGTSTKVTFNTTHYDTDSIFDDANDRVVVPAGMAGKWQFSGQLCMKELTDGSETLCVLKLNNTTDYLVGRYSLSSATKQIACSFCLILSLSEADYVEMWVQHASANSDVRSGANLTTLQATYLG